MREPAQDTPAFLADGGRVGALMREHDWTGSPLGPPESWPPSLGVVVGLMLNSKFPMFVAWGPELGLLYNDSYADILGGKHPVALGARFRDVWAEIWDDISPIIAQAMQGKGTYHENLPLILNRKGYDEQAWFTFSYSPVRDESGTVAGMYCAVTETTAQVLTEQHRVKELERMRNLFQQAPGIIAILREPDHMFELVNDAYFELVGSRDLIGKPVREALPELQGQGFFELLDGVYASGDPFVGRAVPVKLQRTPDGSLEERFLDFIYQPIRDHQGNVYGIFIEGSDVTESVLATQALRESELRLRQLANTIPQLAWMADAAGQVHWFNDRWYEYTGTTLDEAQGSGWKKAIHPSDLPDVLSEWQASMISGQPYEVTMPIRGANGEYRTFATRAAPLRDAQGRIVQWFGTNTDITELEQAQEELKLANLRKDEFLAMLAHELRNPLAPISTAAELLKLANLDESRIRQTSNVIARQVGHMTELVDDLLDVSRVTRGQITLDENIWNVSDLVADAIEQAHALIEQKRHHLAIEVPDQPCFIKGDRTRLVQVFSNILNNAAKYTPERGHINVRLACVGEYVEFGVLDDGIGIADTLLPHIFDLFTQGERSPARSQGGLGLGLALVKSLVELHRGSVVAYSAGENRGSEFVVRLPRLTLHELPRPVRPDGMRKRGDGTLRVMLVDDNQDAARTMAALLETLGYQVFVSDNGTDALEAAQRFAPAVLFLDIGLPDMDGYQLARKLRDLPQTAQATLVAITGYGQPEDRERALAAGFDHYLVKPVKPEQVLDLLSEMRMAMPGGEEALGGQA